MTRKKKNHNYFKNGHNLTKKEEKKDNEALSKREKSLLNKNESKDDNIVNLIIARFDFFTSISKKISLIRSNATTWIQEKTKKIEDVKTSKPKLITQIEQTFKSILKNFNIKRNNNSSPKNISLSLITAAQTNLQKLKNIQTSNKIINQQNLLDIPIVQHVTESTPMVKLNNSTFSFTFSQDSSNIKKNYSSPPMQKLMSLKVKPPDVLLNSPKQLPRQKKIFSKSKYGMDSFSTMEKNERKMHELRPYKCNCEEYLDCLANNMLMLEWVSGEQELGIYDRFKFKEIANQIFPKHAMEKYSIRKKEIETKFLTREQMQSGQTG